MRKLMILSTMALASVITYGAYDYNDNTQQHLTEIECLTQNIYHEARGENVLGQIAVAHVTMNRRDSENFPNTICEVVWQPNQFSWTNDGRSDRMRDEEAAAVARNIAEWVYTGREEDPTYGSLFYHADYVYPHWADHMEVATVIDTHVFYTWDGKW